MAINKIYKGDRLDWTNATGAAVAAGDPVLVSKTFGVALTDIAADASGVLDLEGVYEIRKAKNEAISQGDNLYWDADGDPQGAASGIGCLTATLSGNVYAGRAFAGALAADTVVQIKLNV